MMNEAKLEKANKLKKELDLLNEIMKLTKEKSTFLVLSHVATFSKYLEHQDVEKIVDMFKKRIDSLYNDMKKEFDEL